MTVRNTRKSHRLPGYLAIVFVAVFGMLLSGCDLAQNYLKSDRAANMEMQDYRDVLAPREPEVEETDSASSIPDLQPYVASGSQEIDQMPLVSISVNQSVPIRDILFELAKQADYDIELDPRIRGSIIFTARERPFDQVIDRIADIADLRYKFEDDVLRIELDTPYNQTYKIDYLSYIRSNKASVRNDVNVVSGDGADTGSSFEATAESEANFWGELETSLTQILGAAAPALKTSKDPRIMATEQNPEVAAVTATDAQGNPVTEVTAGQPANVQVAPPQAVLKVESLPIDEEEAGGRGGSGAAASANPPTFSLNKQAGIINVYASERAHKEVAEYLKLLRKSVTAQVLIEAKVLEVSLDDNHETGIDWRAVNLPGSITTLNFMRGSAGATALNSLGINSNGAASGVRGFNVGFENEDIDAFLTALSDFGTVKALASPRLTVLNNQSAILNVATNRVFFELDIDVTTNDTSTQTDISSDIRNVPEGVLINVIPSINLDNGTISMAVRPTITRVVANINDPAIDYIAAAADPPIEGLESTIPEMNVQEIDSVIQVRSGQPIVMGGLLQDRATNDEEVLPVLGEVPMLGNLFRSHDDSVSKTELVIFLKATILDSPSDSVHDTDRDIYRAFSSDRRPFKL